MLQIVVIVYGTEMKIGKPNAFYSHLAEVLSKFVGNKFEIYLSTDKRYDRIKKISVFAYFSNEIEEKIGEIKKEFKKALISFFPNGIGGQISIIAKKMDDFEPAAASEPEDKEEATINISLHDLEATQLKETPLIRTLRRAGFETLGEVAAKTERQLCKMKIGIGKSRLKELKLFLKKFNLELLRKD